MTSKRTRSKAPTQRISTTPRSSGRRTWSRSRPPGSTTMRRLRRPPRKRRRTAVRCSGQQRRRRQERPQSRPPSRRWTRIGSRHNGHRSAGTRSLRIAGAAWRWPAPVPLQPSSSSPAPASSPSSTLASVGRAPRRRSRPSALRRRRRSRRPPSRGLPAARATATTGATAGIATELIARHLSWSRGTRAGRVATLGV